MAKPAHYRGSYHVQARKVRDAANADPGTLCRRCGLPARAGDPWEAGHVIDGDPRSPLAPEHRSCNRSSGAKRGNRLRGARRAAQKALGAPRHTSTRW